MFSRKQMIKLLAPLIVEQIMAVLVGMVDVVMVAAVGESAVSGVSLVDSISVLIIQIMGALATGGAVISAQYLGKEQPRDARKAAGQLVLVTLLLSVIIAGTALAGGRHLLGGIFGKVEQDVMDNAQTYFWITALSYPFIGLYNACAALFRSMGNSKVSMMTSFVMNMINIIGNAICVFGLKMGVAGVAWPTLISRVTAAFMMFVLIQSRNNSIRLNSWKFLIPDRHMIKNILSIGIPNGLENGMFQIGKLLVAGLITTFGTSAIAANAICNNVGSMSNIPGSAIGLAMITVVGQCVGAKDYQQARHYTKTPVGGGLCEHGPAEYRAVPAGAVPGGLLRHAADDHGPCAFCAAGELRCDGAYLAVLVHTTQRAARGGRRQVHDGDEHGVHVGVPHRHVLCAGRVAGHGLVRRLDGHADRLGRAFTGVRRAFSGP